MRPAKAVADILFYITRVIAFLCLALCLYVAVVLLLSLVASWAPIAVADGSFTIFFPFSRRPFFLGEYNLHFVTTSLLAFGGYTCFIWLLSSVFQAFRGRRLFTQRNVGRLVRFFRFNLAAPVIGMAVLLTWQSFYTNALVISLLHVVLGTFTYFMATIFKQGLILQEEQDLTL
ncbi:MAG: DUF2975 domain-containing protein [Chitinophagaceae bacterium]|nr:MAG: DUF2975 domain-containing protein [Chitinophagaceae bacterium]